MGVSDCGNKVPHTGWLQAAELCCPAALEAGRLRIKCWQGRALRRAWGRVSPGLSPSPGSRGSLARRSSIPVLCPHLVSSPCVLTTSSLWVSVSASKFTPLIGTAVTLGWAHRNDGFNLITPGKAMFLKKGLQSEVLGGWEFISFLGDTTGLGFSPKEACELVSIYSVYDQRNL